MKVVAGGCIVVAGTDDAGADSGGDSGSWW